MITASEYSRMVDCGAFDHLDRRVELFRGEIREMNPAGPVHNDYIAYLNHWSVRNTTDDKIRVLVQLDLDLGDLDSRPEPDLLWVQAGRYLNRHPTAADVRLAIECIRFEFAGRLDRESRALWTSWNLGVLDHRYPRAMYSCLPCASRRQVYGTKRVQTGRIVATNC